VTHIFTVVWVAACNATVDTLTQRQCCFCACLVITSMCVRNWDQWGGVAGVRGVPAEIASSRRGGGGRMLRACAQCMTQHVLFSGMTRPTTHHQVLQPGDLVIHTLTYSKNCPGNSASSWAASRSPLFWYSLNGTNCRVQQHNDSMYP
jgi:hypothetical protein